MRYLFTLIGFIFFGLGVLGVYLPVLPATPFFILAVIFFNKGSEKFRGFVEGTSFYKENVKPIKDREGMTIRTKLRILGTLSIFFLISFILMKNSHGRIALVVVWLGHLYYFFFRIDTVDGDK